MTERFTAGAFSIGANQPLGLIAGPCVMESEDLVMTCAETLKTLTDKLNIPWVFKSSFDKANRTSVDSYRGPGLETGLKLLAKVKAQFDVPVISDVHEVAQIAPAAEVLDIMQIPAFLCRQTDLLVAAGKSGKAISIKKGQFVAPWDMTHPVEKVRSTGNNNIAITERGTTMGYNNLVVDMTAFKVMRDKGYPVIFDATHSTQLPGGEGKITGGRREMIPSLARAAVAAGIDGLFMEVHPDPPNAKCDSTNQFPLDQLEPLLTQLMTLDGVVKHA